LFRSRARIRAGGPPPLPDQNAGDERCDNDRHGPTGEQGHCAERREQETEVCLVHGGRLSDAFRTGRVTGIVGLPRDERDILGTYFLSRHVLESPKPLSHIPQAFRKAADGGRTRDLRLGKPTLYQLSYHRVRRHSKPWRRVEPAPPQAHEMTCAPQRSRPAWAGRDPVSTNLSPVCGGSYSPD
jgi:hypothetical protein